MRESHEAAGAVFGDIHGMSVPRHYGNPAGEYQAAVTGIAVADRSHRTRLYISGKAPAQMLQGLLSGRIPVSPLTEDSIERVRWEYSLVLTPKGRIISDLRATRLGGTTEAFLLDVPAAGAPALGEHLKRSLPPRLASTDDRSRVSGMLTVMGPESAGFLSREALGLRVEEVDLVSLEEGEGVRVPDGDDLGVIVVRNAEVATPAFDVVADSSTVSALWRRLVETGASPAGHGVFQTLRVEAGRPAFGIDLDEKTIPFEAGLVDRAVDHEKGCYTGQEVIVRIRDRGHVNRHLRGLVIGEGVSLRLGAELFDVEGGKPVGVITSVAQSPRASGTLALGYVRREVDVPGSVRLNAPDGFTVEVRELGEGWAF